MLDLKKLEQQLDDALAKETPEGIKEWLLEQRTKPRLTTVKLMDDKAILIVQNPNRNNETI